MSKSQRRPRPIETRLCTPDRARELPWEVETVSPGSLKAAKRNARTHNEAQIDLIANSILRFGFIRPVVIDERNRIVAGYGTWLAAKKLGLRQIPVIRVSHLSETQLRAYALADNQLATKSGWDRELLQIELGELELALPEIGLDLSMLGFDAGEIDRLNDDFGEAASNSADEISALENGPAVAQLGDVFVLGRHQLLVGDAGGVKLMRTRQRSARSGLRQAAS